MLISLLLFSACAAAKYKIGGKSTRIPTDSDTVSLAIKEGTLTASGAVCVLQNNSDQELIYGEAFLLEVKKDGDWHEMVLDQADFVTGEYIISAEASAEWPAAWSDLYGELPAGTYRILKEPRSAPGTAMTSYEFELK